MDHQHVEPAAAGPGRSAPAVIAPAAENTRPPLSRRAPHRPAASARSIADASWRPRPAVTGRQPVIAVVGGSLTGPVTALLLLQAGFEQVSVYEAAPSSAPLGGGLISLEHSALDILDRVGVLQEDFVTAASESIVQIEVSARTPRHHVRRVYPGRFTTWTRLHAAVTSCLPAGVIESRCQVTGLQEHGGRPLLRFADGRCESADLIVFADGRASTGRRLLDPQRRLRYAGYVAHRGCAPAPARPLADFLRFEPGPGAQFNIAPVPEGSDWTFYLNASAREYAACFGAAPERRVFALPAHVSLQARQHVDESAGACLPPEQADAVSATRTRMAVPVMDIDVPTRMVWPIGSGHAVLLGDALAPVRPHTARGANNGIEQAGGLAAVLTQHRRYHADLGGALTGWQRRHLPAATAAVRLGPAIGSRLGLGQP
jgi:2-polyprenyl-6-methoxyphenol hydroxylase-like FAD-dependent oxidoreductase